MNSAAKITLPMTSIPSPMRAFGQDLDLRTSSQIEPTVFVVEDDIDTQHSLELLIRAQGWRSQTCDSAREFLSRPRPFIPSCLILAFSATDSNGLEVQKRIARECAEIPIIVIADYGDIPTTVQAIKAGAVDFLVKPFGNDLLIAAIRQSLVRSRAALDRCMEMHELRSCYALLTPRE